MESKDWLEVQEWGLLTLIFTLGPRWYGWIIFWLSSFPPSDPMLVFLSISPWAGQKFPQEEPCNLLPREWGLANCQILAAEWGEGGSFCINVFLSTFTGWFVDSWEQIHDQVSSAQENRGQNPTICPVFHSMLPTSAIFLWQSLSGPVYQLKHCDISDHLPQVFNMLLVHLQSEKSLLILACPSTSNDPQLASLFRTGSLLYLFMSFTQNKQKPDTMKSYVFLIKEDEVEGKGSKGTE